MSPPIAGSARERVTRLLIDRCAVDYEAAADMADAIIAELTPAPTADAQVEALRAYREFFDWITGELRQADSSTCNQSVPEAWRDIADFARSGVFASYQEDLEELEAALPATKPELQQGHRLLKQAYHEHSFHGLSDETWKRIASRYAELAGFSPPPFPEPAPVSGGPESFFAVMASYGLEPPPNWPPQLVEAARRAPLPAGREAARPMADAPRDNTIVSLLIDYSEDEAAHPLNDATLAWTIGSNNFDNDEVDEWKFAGWCWTHDHWVEGAGKPIAWIPWSLPEPDEVLAALAPAGQTEAG